MTLRMDEARSNALRLVEEALYALLCADAEKALANDTYLRVLMNTMNLRAFLLSWEVMPDD